MLFFTFSFAFLCSEFQFVFHVKFSSLRNTLEALSVVNLMTYFLFLNALRVLPDKGLSVFGFFFKPS